MSFGYDNLNVESISHQINVKLGRWYEPIKMKIAVFQKKVVRRSIPALIPIIIGSLIYILWRPLTIRIFSWLDIIGLSIAVEKLRKLSMSIYPYVPDWVVYSVPNGLWAFSYALIITIIWWRSESIVKYFWLGSIPILGLGYELLQLRGVIQGTFCWQDLNLCILGIGSGVITGRMVRRKEK